LVTFVHSLFIDIEAIGILHNEFASTHDAEARPNLISELGLDLIEIERHLAIRSNFFSGNIRDDLLVGGPQTTISVVAVLQPCQLASIFFPSMALLPELRRLNKGEKDLNGTGSVHLLTDDGLYFSNGSKAER
jgi:hypothetical protein